MNPAAERLTMYGEPSTADALDWSWVDNLLGKAAGYWVAVSTPGHPHPRPVWGVWNGEILQLSIGSQRIASAMTGRAAVTVHVGDINDVVILEGFAGGTSDDRAAVEAYNAKYDWDYRVDAYGPFTVVHPSIVLAWRSAGWAGRDGFRQSGRWRFAVSDG